MVNIKYGAWINCIKTSLAKTRDVTAVEIFKGEYKVCITGVNLERAGIVAKLAWLGYPEKGSNRILSRPKPKLCRG
jgi:hypothetical protein